MQKIIMARTLALSLAAGILFTACSDNNAQKAEGEMGKSLGRVMDTITQPIERAFAPRVESKEMEKNSKAYFILRAKKSIRVSSKMDDCKITSLNSLRIIRYEVSKTIDDVLQYAVVLRADYNRKCDSIELYHQNEHPISDLYYIAERKPIIQKDGTIMHGDLSKKYSLKAAKDVDEEVDATLKMLKAEHS